MRFRLVSLLLLLTAMTSAAQEQPSKQTLLPPADLVILNGAVWTVDPAKPKAEAVAVVRDKIAAVGTNAEIRKWIGPATETIDARGGSVLPGLIDSHVHFAGGGFELSSVQLRDAATPQEFARRIGEFAKKLPKREWIQGGTWDHELWGGDPLPHRKWIDALTPDQPVMVTRYDGHMALANSAALRLAGVTRDTPTPDGGAIVKDADGEPTGLLKDSAMDLVFRVIPPPSEEQLTRAVKAALAEAARFGVTGVHDMSSGDNAAEFRVYQKLAASGELTARILAVTPIELWESPARTGITAGFGNHWLRTGALKGFADGSLGSTTALFFEPYNDEPGTSGLPAAMMFPEGNMQKMALGADKTGLQLCIHAIGDKAIHLILGVYDEVRKQNGERPRRWRIEHAQHIHTDDFATFARLGVIASMQPYHAIDDGRWAEKRIGFERGKGTYAFRTLLDKGVRLAFGSDWPVAPLNPIEGIYAAVTRRTLDGKNPGGWYPEQKITLAETIEAYTMGSAYAEGAEAWKGSLTPGKLADVVVLDANLFTVAPEKINAVKILATIVGGKTVYPSASKK